MQPADILHSENAWEEGHELSRSGSPRHRIQRAELILDFFGGRRPEVSRLG